MPLLSAILALLVFLVLPNLTLAAPRNPVQESISAFLHKQTQYLPGKTELIFEEGVGKNTPSPCSNYEIFLPNNGRVWGRTPVGIRCIAPNDWTIYTTVNVKIWGTYVVTARPVPARQILSAQDLALRQGDLTQLPDDILLQTDQAIGQTLRTGVPAHFMLRTGGLVGQQAITQGQSVKLIAKGQGFSITSEGKATTSAREGQPVSVKTTGGHTVSGIARSGGIVEVSTGH